MCFFKCHTSFWDLNIIMKRCNHRNKKCALLHFCVSVWVINMNKNVIITYAITAFLFMIHVYVTWRNVNVIFFKLFE